jgi:hypothetical protein
MNDDGQRTHSLEVEMAAFDRLPLMLRQTLCQAAFRWSALSAAEELATGTPAPVVAHMILTADRKACGRPVP